ncbi:hypothetical protein WR25_21666 [Diploscapter pachys]|uniref:Uncharacterized protein n=1 Tax=Diploscapter pachys TaxID=2018661 RepID=A0A2A2LBT8_9BILA|nr:hypothetical protein WR25_21666 [Diploscapter pachys]
MKCALEYAFNATSHILKQVGQGFGQNGQPSQINALILQIWSIRFQLMMSLKMHNQLVEEMLAFDELDAPDLYFQYKDPNKLGSMIPFAMRLIHAEILRFTPFPWKAIARIKKLEGDVERIIYDMKVPGHIDDWKKRLDTVKTLHSNVLYNIGEYEKSMDVMENIRRSSENEEKAELSRAMLRMAIFAGDERAATKYLDESAKFPCDRLLLHKCYRTMFHGAYPHAQAYNAMAILHLYTGNVRQAIGTLAERLEIICTPMQTNLKTLSELGLPVKYDEILKAIKAQAT